MSGARPLLPVSIAFLSIACVIPRESFAQSTEGLGACAGDAPCGDIVTSYARRPRAIEEIGASVSILRAEDLERGQFAFIADAVRQAPGVTLSRNGAFGGVASVRLRGASTGQTLVVIDGVVVNDPSAPQGGFNFATLDLVDVDRIEVLRGPQSLVWGADAIGGVIAISTKRAADAGAQGFVEGGSLGTARGGATLTAGSASRYARFTISGSRSDGVSRAADGDETDGFRSIAGSASLGADLGPVWALAFTARAADARSDIDGFPPPDFSFADTEETDSAREFALSGRLSHETDGLGGALTLAYSRIDRRNEDQGVETFSADGERLAADYVIEADIHHALRVTAGAEFEATATDAAGEDERARSGGAFALFEVSPIDAVTASFGARRDEYSNVEGATTIRAALAWRASPSTFIRASWGEGFRAPTLFELNFSQFGVTPNPDLRPERGRGFDIGVERRFSPQADSGIQATARATYFDQRVRDQIDFEFARNGFFNIARVRSRGVEAEAELSFGARWNWRAAYTYTDAADRDSGLALRRIPAHSATLTATYAPTRRLALASTLIWNGREPDAPTDNNSFARLDLRASYKIARGAELFGRVENATDTDYQDVSGFGEPGVVAFAGLRVKR